MFYIKKLGGIYIIELIEMLDIKKVEKIRAKEVEINEKINKMIEIK